MSLPHTLSAVDPFDLPDWLGASATVWTAESSVRGSHHVRGRLSGADQHAACDLLAGDVAYPQPVLDGPWRRSAHQAWTYGQVQFVEYDGRLTLLVPGTEFTADLVLESLSRLAKAVGVSPTQLAATLRL